MKFVNIEPDTQLRLVREIDDPYFPMRPGDFASVRWFAAKFGRTTRAFIDDLESGKLDIWFELKE